MKKIILPLALLAGAAGTAAAQKPGNAVGITVGYGRTRLLDNNQYTSVGHSGYQAGLTADAYLSEVVSFHPEVLYSLRYFDTKDNDALNRDVQSVDVPLLVRYHADGLYFEAGPEIDLPVKAVDEAGDDVKSQLNSVALNYIVGLGYRFGTGPALGVRYDGGASNLFKSNTATTLGTGQFKTSSIWLVLAYSFGGK